MSDYFKLEPLSGKALVQDMMGLSQSAPKTSGKIFEDFYNAAMDIVNETNGYQLNAIQIERDIVSGKSDDIISLTMAQQRAYSSLEFTVSVTNKIIEAYRQIMQIQL